VAVQLGLDVSRGETAAVLVSGELDAFAARGLEDQLTRLAARGIVDIALDFSEVAFVDSYGLAALSRVREHVRALGGELTVCHASPQARRVAALVQFAFSPAPAGVENAAVG